MSVAPGLDPESEPVSSSSTILWRRLDRAGHEASRVARVEARDGGWHLAGAAVFEHERLPCRLDYLVVTDSAWATVSTRVSGWVGNRVIDVEIAVAVSDAGERRWRHNGAECPAVAGCIDVDLNFSPSTNLLPIRRLGLAAGQEAPVRAAWLRFPGFELEPLEQIYRRIDRTTYRYESAGGRFTADLDVNEAGFVTRYPGFCERVTETAGD